MDCETPDDQTMQAAENFGVFIVFFWTAVMVAAVVAAILLLT